MSEQHHDDTGFLGGMGGIQMMGIVNALKTGDPRVDMLIAMCIPVVLRAMFGFAERWRDLFGLQWLFGRWQRPRNKHERFIVHKRTRNSRYGTVSIDNDTRNPVLLKAIQLYIHYKCNLNLMSASLDLTSLEGTAANRNGGFYDDYDSGNNSKTFAGMLNMYEIVKKPPQNQWHGLGEYGTPPSKVELLICEEEQNNGEEGSSSSQQISTFYHFTSSGATAIDEFIDAAYSWYLEELRQLEDNSRHLYELKSLDSSSSGGNSDEYYDGENSGFVYTRYRLSEEKTFDSLFFQQKESLLKLVEHFERKTGKYSIKGYPHKLGLLMHGPPGTGKTSLIKALAQHTGRSIVNVPLSRISTNSELMSVFFDRKYHIQGEYVPVRLGFKDIIFVIEDVDAASKVVKRRDGKKTPDPVESDLGDLPPAKSLWTLMLEGNEQDCQELVKTLMEKSDRLKQEATKPEVLRSIAKRATVVPGLGLVGQGNDNEAVDRIGTDALESASNLMNAYSTVDQFISVHAKCLKARIEAGAEVDDDLVDEILGSNPSSRSNSWVVPSPTVEENDDANARNGNDQLIASMAMMLESGTKSKQAEGENESPVKGFEGFGPSLWPFLMDKDELNLAGLLNVLDGVVDTPGRIVIMTTNHPEMLDPALIRPGRIDKKIMLGYMAAGDVIKMLKHYFQEDLTDDHRQRVELAITGSESRPKLNLTPAQVEQMCAEHDEIEDMIQQLENRG